MGKARWIGLIVLLALIGGGLAAWFCRPAPEPRYKGMPLSFWLKGYENPLDYIFREAFLPPWVRAYAAKNPPLPKPGPLPTQSEAHEAVEQLGTNVIPTLLAMMSDQDSWWKDTLLVLARREIRPGYFAAGNAIRDMGLQATNLVPGLIKIHNTNPKPIFYLLSELGSNAAPAVPMLAQEASRKGYKYRFWAVLALGKLQAKPELTVPAMMMCLRDPDEQLRAQAALVLGQFGKSALVAVPALRELLKQSSSPVTPANKWTRVGDMVMPGTVVPPGMPHASATDTAWLASNALYQIDHDVAGKPGAAATAP